MLRIRGDGRPYAINLHSDGFFDVTWHDIYTYVLYTRGGPHWQLTKVAEAEFFRIFFIDDTNFKVLFFFFFFIADHITI